MSETVEYLGYSLSGDIHRTQKDGQLYKVFVYKLPNNADSDASFVESSFITGTAISMMNGSRSISAERYLRKLTFSKAKGRILLGLFEMGKDYLQNIASDSLRQNEIGLDEETTQKWILTGLANVRRIEPTKYKTRFMDIDGFCQILSITKNDFIFNASILLEKGLISVPDNNESMLESANCFITALGLDEIKRIQNSHNLKNFHRDGVSMGLENETYDVAISFAGEDRIVAEEIAEKLKTRGVKVFYDDFEKADLWGKNLYDHLSFVYGEAARFCLVLISENYARKNWTNLERQAAQAKAFRQKIEYILPIRLDDTQIPGISETVGYIALKENSVDKIVDLLILKLKKIY